MTVSGRGIDLDEASSRPLPESESVARVLDVVKVVRQDLLHTCDHLLPVTHRGCLRYGDGQVYSLNARSVALWGCPSAELDPLGDDCHLDQEAT